MANDSEADLDVRAYNRKAWDNQVEIRNRWTVPVDTDTIARARHGDWAVALTPSKPVPRHWFPDLGGLDVLCLASGGGQQGPILAAAGANVTVLDNSPRQLERDRLVAERDSLELHTVLGDMADLSMFAYGSFGLVFHPCSNSFVPEVRPVWNEASRVLREGGTLLAGFTNPVRYIFDDETFENGSLEVRFSIPYSHLTSLNDADRQRLVTSRGEPLEFGHTLEDQIGGQLDAGLVLAGFFEDRYGNSEHDPIDEVLPTFIATRALKSQRED